MNIPAIVLSEAHQTTMDDDMPTLPGSTVTRLWTEAATTLARRLIECARIKQRCMDVLDTEGARLAYKYANELSAMAKVLSSLENLQPELRATTQRQTVDRVMKIYEMSSGLLAIERSDQSPRT
jgi:ATP-dependent Clp protease ATP-binding subunit ClpA